MKTTYANQMTIAELTEKNLNQENFEYEDFEEYFLSNEWGETETGTMEQWESEIPETDEDAQQTGFYNWFNDSNSITWDDYRDMLLNSLIKIDVIL